MTLANDPKRTEVRRIGALDFTVREVTGTEKSAWWARATAVRPDYDNDRAATDREIPLFLLEPWSVS